jgi:hypothetical protein
MNRLLSLACAGLVLVTSSASANPYLSVDAGFVHRSGSYRWASAPYPVAGNTDPSLVVLDATATGSGAAIDVAAGWTIHRAVSVAVEGGISYASGSSTGLRYGGIGEIFDARIGPRLEVRCRYPLYARIASGIEWIGFGMSGNLVGARDNVVENEALRGIYGALTVGLRMTHLGVFARGEVTRATSEHATYTPLGIVIGADATWF